MKIQWLGHACFKLTTKNGTGIVIDPYDDKTGYGELSVRSDVLIVSHSHHDHANLSSVSGVKMLANHEGEYSFKDVRVLQIGSYHDKVQGAKRGKNLLTRVEADGQCAVHLGDLGHEPDEKQLEFISNADVMMIPVGGFYTIDTQTAIDILMRTKPTAAIPMHYKTADNEYPIAMVDEFAEKTHAQILNKNTMEIADLHGSVVMEWKNR